MRPVEQKALNRLRKSADGKQLQRELCDAAHKGWANVVTYLLERGVSVDSRRNGRTALALAAQCGRDHTEVARILLDAGANPNASGVVDECGVESLPIVLAAGGNVEGSQNGPNPLLTAIINRTKQDKALALLSKGANPNVRDGNGTTALMHALLNGRDEVFDALIQGGADSHAVDSTGRSALRYGLETLCLANGATQSDARRAKPLVERLAKSFPAQPEDSILCDIVLGNELALSERLNNGLDPNTFIQGAIGILGIARETFDESLTDSIHAISESVVADTKQLDRIAGGTTLLMWAVAAQQTSCIESLLDHGADPELTNADGVSAFTLSNSPRYNETVRKLIRSAI